MICAGLFNFSVSSFYPLVGPSLDPSGINIVDCVRVYSRSKEEFGWPEKPPATGLSMVRKQIEDGIMSDDSPGDSTEMLSSADDSRNMEPLEKSVCR